jgi:hypothetical protein
VKPCLGGKVGGTTGETVFNQAGGDVEPSSTDEEKIVVAAVAGMVVLGPAASMLPNSIGWAELLATPRSMRWSWATNMTVAMAAWMRFRRHGWAAIAEMAVAMYAPFLVLFPPLSLAATIRRSASYFPLGVPVTSGSDSEVPARSTVATLASRRDRWSSRSGCQDRSGRRGPPALTDPLAGAEHPSSRIAGRAPGLG